MSAYTLLGKSPLLTASLADRPFDESLKTILNRVPNKMKFFPIHYFSPDDLIIGTTKVSVFNPVLSGRKYCSCSTPARARGSSTGPKPNRVAVLLERVLFRRLSFFRTNKAHWNPIIWCRIPGTALDCSSNLRQKTRALSAVYAINVALPDISRVRERA